MKSEYMEYFHGGDIYQKNPIHKKWLDFSANINFLGMPKNVCIAAQKAVEESVCYPDARKRELTCRLAEYLSIPEEMILLGNGAAELLYAFSFACLPKRGLLLAPSFLEYQRALLACRCEIDTIFLKREEQFSFTERVQKLCLEKIKNADVFILCNPNNPTGWTIPKKFLLECIKECERCRTYLILDECFLDFVDGEETLLSFCKEYSYLMVLRAFTKIYAMPGLRLGYLISKNLDLKKAVQNVIQPWNVSLPAQMAGIAALQEEEYLRKTRQALRQEKEILHNGLEWFQENTDVVNAVYGDKANFIFFSGEERLAEWLRQKGILIRDCRNYNGLQMGDFRICVREKKENQILLDTMLMLVLHHGRISFY